MYICTFSRDEFRKLASFNGPLRCTRKKSREIYAYRITGTQTPELSRHRTLSATVALDTLCHVQRRLPSANICLFPLFSYPRQPPPPPFPFPPPHRIPDQGMTSSLNAPPARVTARRLYGALRNAKTREFDRVLKT